MFITSLQGYSFQPPLFKPTPFHNVSEEELNKASVEVKKELLNYVEAVNGLLSFFSFRDITEWKPSTRAQVLKNYDPIKDLKKKGINPVGIIRLLENMPVSLNDLFSIEVNLLQKIIHRPGPEPLMFLLEVITWDKLIALPPDVLEEMLIHHRAVLSFNRIKVTPTDLLAISSEKRAWAFSMQSQIEGWIDLKANWQEIIETDMGALKELSAKPIRTTVLLNVTNWSSLSHMDPKERAKVLQNAMKIAGLMEEQKLSWEEAVKAIP